MVVVVSVTASVVAGRVVVSGNPVVVRSSSRVVVSKGLANIVVVSAGKEE